MRDNNYAKFHLVDTNVQETLPCEQSRHDDAGVKTRVVVWITYREYIGDTDDAGGNTYTPCKVIEMKQ